MFLKRFFYIISAIILCLFILVASLPTLLSTKWAQSHYVIPLIEKSSGGRLSVGDASFSWFGSQKIEQFHWNNAQTDIKFQSLSFDAPFYKYFFSPSALHPAKLENLTIHLSDQIQLNDLDGDIVFRDGAFHLAVDGKTTQNGQSGKLEIHGEIPLSKYFTKGKLTAKMENFPSQFLKIPITSANVPLHEFLGEELNGTLTYENGVVDVVAATSQGSAEFTFQFVSDGVVFPRNGKVTYNMPAKAAEKLEQAGLIALHSPFTIQLAKGESPTMNLQVDSIQLHQDVSLKKLYGSIQFEKGFLGGEIHLTGFIHESGGESPLSLNGSFSFDPRFEYDLHIAGQQLKTTLIQSFFHDPNHSFKSIANATLGSNIEANLHLFQKDGDDYVEIQMTSDRLKIPGALFKLKEDHVSLVEATNFDVNFSPTNFFQQPDPLVPQAVPMTIQLKEFEMKLRPIIAPQDIHVNAHISTKEVFFSKLPSVGQGALTNGLLSIEGPSLAKVKASFIGRINQFDNSKLISKLLGNEIRFETAINATFSDDWDLAVNDFSLKSDDPTLKLALKGKQMSSNPYGLAISGDAIYTMLPVNFAESGDSVYYRLIAPMNVHVHLDRAEIDTRHPSWEHTSFGGKIVIDRIVAGASDSQAVASLSQVEIPWNFQTKSQELAFSFDAVSQNEGLGPNGRLQAKAEIRQFLTEGKMDMTQWSVNADVDLDAFPVAILEALFAKDGMDELLGLTLDAKLSVHDDQEGEEGHVTFTLKGDELLIEGALKAKESLTLEDPKEPITIEWTMTPERFNHFRRLVLKHHPTSVNQLTLAHSSRLTVTVSDLIIPLDHLTGAKGTFDFNANEVTIRDNKSQDLVSLDRLSAQAHSEDIGKSLDLNFYSEGHIYNQDNETFQLSFNSTIQNLFNTKGLWNLDYSTFQAKCDAKQAPILLLTNIFAIDPAIITQIDALIGNRLDANLAFSITEKSGPIQLALAGSSGKLSLEGRLNQGILTLNSPLAAEIQISPKLTDSILDEIVPFLNSAESSDKLVSLAISPKGFEYPLLTDEPGHFKVGSMRIDLGKILFRNNHQIADILTLLKYSHENNLITIWFTPLYLSYDNDVVTLQRMDMLVANQYPIAVWGKVNFAQDKMSFKIGLGGTTLKRAFGLKGVPKNYYLQVPLKGSPSNPNLDVGGASTKIGAMMAQLRGGPQGVIVGGIMDIIGTTMGQKPTPPPTTNPFPWDVANPQFDN